MGVIIDRTVVDAEVVRNPADHEVVVDAEDG